VIVLVTDSNAQLPAPLSTRYGVSVVPITVVVDGVPYREGVDLEPKKFYEQLRSGPTVSTAAPSPGEFAAVYEEAAAGGADAVLSIHLGSNVSSTVNAARLASQAAPLPVEVVDTGTASFAVGCCVWAAGEALASGAGLAEAAEEARSVASRVGNVFIAGALSLARKGGRLATEVADRAVPVLALEAGVMRQVDEVTDPDAAVEAMATYVTDRVGERRLRVGVGDAEAGELARELTLALERRPEAVAEVVRYEIGPSIAAHTGIGSVGAVFYS
jgi:DegV family protein with EDD domain